MPRLLAIRRLAWVIRLATQRDVASDIVPFDHDPLPRRRVPQFLVDRVRCSSRASGDLLKRESRKQTFSRTELAIKKKVLPHSFVFFLVLAVSRSCVAAQRR